MYAGIDVTVNTGVRANAGGTINAGSVNAGSSNRPIAGAGAWLFDPCAAFMEEISDSPLHFITSESNLLLPSHKLGTGPEPMNTANCKKSICIN